MPEKDLKIKQTTETPNSLTFYDNGKARKSLKPTDLIKKAIRSNNKPHLEIAIDPVGKLIPNMTIFDPEEFDKVTEQEFKEIIELAKTKRISLSVHLPWLSKKENNGRVSFPLSAKEDIEMMLKSLKIAKKLGANLTVMHGPSPYEPNRVKHTRELIRKAKQLGLPAIALENSFHNTLAYNNPLKFFSESRFMAAEELIHMSELFPEAPICLDLAHLVIGELEDIKKRRGEIKLTKEGLKIALRNLVFTAKILGHRIKEIHIANVPKTLVTEGIPRSAFKKDSHTIPINAKEGIITNKLIKTILNIIAKENKDPIRRNVILEQIPKKKKKRLRAKKTIYRHKPL
jgi:hypothetical protein